MDFFNKYKDLFDVPQGLPLPSKKLSINNNLFIDKPFVPTYTETVNLNSKLKALKRDHDDLDYQIAQLQNIPKRAVSRKNRDKSDNSNNRGNIPNNSNIGKDMKDILTKKRGAWLYDEQKNISKHSQMDYIFNDKIKEEGPNRQNMYERRVPKAQNFLFGAENSNNTPISYHKKNKESQNFRSDPKRNQHNVARQQNSNIPDQSHRRNRSKIPDDNNNKQGNNGRNSAALERRNHAKKNLTARRDKLSYLLRTSW